MPSRVSAMSVDQVHRLSCRANVCRWSTSRADGPVWGLALDAGVAVRSEAWSTEVLVHTLWDPHLGDRIKCMLRSVLDWPPTGHPAGHALTRARPMGFNSAFSMQDEKNPYTLPLLRADETKSRRRVPWQPDALTPPWFQASRRHGTHIGAPTVITSPGS